LGIPALRDDKGGNVSAKDKVKNQAKNQKGNIEEGVGHVTDNKSMTMKGKGRQASANLKQAGEKVKDSAKGVTK